jgi:hypothetical protein
LISRLAPQKWRIDRVAGQGEIPVPQTTIPAQSQCTKSISAMRQRTFSGFLEKATTSLRARRKSYDIDRAGRFARSTAANQEE